MQMTYRHGEIYSWTRRLPAAAASKFHRSRLSVSLHPAQNCRNELTSSRETCVLPPPRSRSNFNDGTNQRFHVTFDVERKCIGDESFWAKDFDSLEFLKLGRCLVREKRDYVMRYRIKICLTIFLRVM